MSASQIKATERCNAVILRGVVHRAPEQRELDSGAVVLSFDLATNEETAARELVPVAWQRPAMSSEGTTRGASGGLEVVAGIEVVVTGRVRRRFFRAGGATQSRTEVIADEVVPVRQRRRAASAIERALAAVGEDDR